MAVIEPIKMMTMANSASELSRIRSESAKEKVSSTGMFSDILANAIRNVEQTDNAVINDTEKLATGSVDDLHNLSIDNMKSQLAVNMMVQMRNRALDSYNTLMQITV
ncbi:MAG: flagellar hook-basal body complex protein FliE [Clostridia bacterium]|nr:flagellar hook-basal body complex protein FliE [Clostridia bacterium]